MRTLSPVGGPHGDCVSESADLRSEITCRSTINQLENVLMTEFGNFDSLEGEEKEQKAVQKNFGRYPRVSELLMQWKVIDNNGETDDARDRRQNFLYRVTEHRYFALFFMALTLYSLFAPDFEVFLGNKESKVAVSIITTVVFFLFVLEFFLQVHARPQYFLRSYFWLDLIALLSLIPDTYIIQVMFAGESLLAGRSYWLLRILRLSRSSKATRLNRLTRIVRVMALMPRLVFVKKTAVEESERLLERKLFRIFAFLDDDMDGLISEKSMNDCLAKIRGRKLSRKAPQTPRSTGGTGRVLSPTDRGACSPASQPASDPLEIELNDDLVPGPPGVQNTSSSKTGNGGDRWRRMESPGIEDSEFGVNFDTFISVIRQDEEIHTRLIAACRQGLRRSNNMQSLTSRHSEDVGVKVALGVLLMLLVLTLVEPAVQDFSAIHGLEHLDAEVRRIYSNMTTQVPPSLEEHVNFWLAGASAAKFEQKVVYLDLNKLVYCDEFVPTGLPCSQLLPGQSRVLRPRSSLKEIDMDLLASDFRWSDLVPLRLPDSSEMDVTEAELESITTTVAVLDAGERVRQEAAMSIITTVLVIFIILLGIFLLTKDLTYLSRSLLKPLRSLAEEMQSIVQLQLAGLNTEQAHVERGTAEIRQIQRIFDNMKKAIKSWGKYVPWPVVQLLLHAGIDAKPGVEEKEVTLFFSDIASFTSIVESIPPEDSLLLLSRYFNDMSKVIDAHGGIVIEFIGDAILSVYGAPLKNADHATAAVKGTLRMLAALSRINEWSAQHNLPAVHIRCGVHTGRVLVGNMGFHSRMKYGVVGENANIPGRLEELNKTYSTEMLISHATFGRLDPEAFIARPIDYIYLRHSTDAQSEPIYQVLSRDRRVGKGNRLRPVVARHAEALGLYKAREFARAAELFAQVDEAMQEIMGVEVDTPSVMLMKRARHYMERPPPQEWDGVWDQPSEPG